MGLKRQRAKRGQVGHRDSEKLTGSSVPKVRAKTEGPGWLRPSPEPSQGWQLVSYRVLERKSRKGPSFDRKEQ